MKHAPCKVSEGHPTSICCVPTMCGHCGSSCTPCPLTYETIHLLPREQAPKSGVCELKGKALGALVCGSSAQCRPLLRDAQVRGCKKGRRRSVVLSVVEVRWREVGLEGTFLHVTDCLAQNHREGPRTESTTQRNPGQEDRTEVGGGAFHRQSLWAYTGPASPGTQGPTNPTRLFQLVT